MLAGASSLSWMSRGERASRAHPARSRRPASLRSRDDRTPGWVGTTTPPCRPFVQNEFLRTNGRTNPSAFAPVP